MLLRAGESLRRFPGRLYSDRRSMKVCVVSVLFLVLSVFPLRALPSDLLGVWENSSRFIEFSNENGLRIALKTYFGFVYEMRPWVSCTVSSETPASFFTLMIRWPLEKKVSSIPVVRIDDSLYLDFMIRLDGGAKGSTDIDGVWLQAGNATGFLLYPPESRDTVFVRVFSGDRFWRIRYWKTDARKKDVAARFTSNDGTEREVPKFLEISGDLYTCVTGTGTILRNYEQGRVTRSDTGLRFNPDSWVYAETDSLYRSDIPYRLTSAGDVLVLGKPSYTKSSIVDLSAEIEAHNKKRRPLRKPLFDFMKLDFYWDEIERIRNNGRRN